METEIFFNASIRVVKSLVSQSSFFGVEEVLRYPMITAKSKEEVKKTLVEMHPEFFQNGKIYERETSDSAQFFYAIITPVKEYDLKLIREGSWTCVNCFNTHPNKYVDRPRMSYKFGTDPVLFCNDKCYNEYKSKHPSGDDFNYINKDSKNYIYKITEKSSGKCYIGKTRNAPFFRWWNHLTHSKNPFGLYLRETDITGWTFEVLETLPADAHDLDVMATETKWMLHFDSIKSGFNKLMSNKNHNKFDQEQRGWTPK